MDSLIDYSAHYNELVAFFATYLRDMSAAISQIKGLAYALIDIPQSPQKSIPVGNDISSVMFSCKRTLDDIKRIQSILRGHVKGKKSPDSSRISFSSNKYQNQTSTKHLNPCQDLDYRHQSKQKTSSSPKICGQFSSPNHQIAKVGLLNKCQSNELLFTYQQSSDQNQKPQQQKILNLNHLEVAGDYQNDLEIKIEDIRRSRNKQIEQVAESNSECILLIQKIRKQLKTKRK